MTILLEDLNEGQRAGYDAVVQWMLDPGSPIFVISGGAGTGKSTLMRALLDNLPTVNQTIKLIDPTHKPLDTVLTATTHPAADNLAAIAGQGVRTIQSLLGLRPQRDYATGETYLAVRQGAELQYDRLIVLDEGSFVDTFLLRHMMQRTERCKFLVLGDPFQLTPPKSTGCPLFERNYPGIELTEIMRQAADNPLMQVSMMFRETVRTGQFFKIVPDGQAICRLSDDEFKQAIIDEFTDPGWTSTRSKILTYTNNRSIMYNAFIQEQLSGVQQFSPGDYAVVNSFVQGHGFVLNNNETVLIQAIEPATELATPGFKVMVVAGSKTLELFMPASPKLYEKALREARAQDAWNAVQNIERSWVDLRAAYSSTINKSQGRTFDRVYIDLSDIGTCRHKITLARLLYVAFSRARYQVFLRGDI